MASEENPAEPHPGDLCDPADVAAKAYSQDSLRVVNVTKVYGGNIIVDEVSLGVAQGDVSALLGQNDARRCYCDSPGGDISSTKGDTFSTGSRSFNTLVVRQIRGATNSLGVCPVHSNRRPTDRAQAVTAVRG